MKLASIKEMLAKLLSTTMVVETGTNGIWTYRKWSNGTYDAWFVGPINLLAGTAWLNGAYYHASSSALTPPSFSTAVTDMSGSCNRDMLTMFGGRNASYQTYWINGTPNAANALPVRLDIHGTWHVGG